MTAIEGRSTRDCWPAAAAGVAVTVILAAAYLFSPAPAPFDPAEDVSTHSHAAGAHSEAQAARPVTSVKVVSCERLPNVPGKSITTTVVSFPPNAYTPRHRHPGSVTAIVLKGALRSQLEGSAAGTYTVGQTWFEPPGAVHLFAENASQSEPAELLAIFVADDDCGPLTVPF